MSSFFQTTRQLTLRRKNLGSSRPNSDAKPALFRTRHRKKLRLLRLTLAATKRAQARRTRTQTGPSLNPSGHRKKLRLLRLTLAATKRAQARRIGREPVLYRSVCVCVCVCVCARACIRVRFRVMVTSKKTSTPAIDVGRNKTSAGPPNSDANRSFTEPEKRGKSLNSCD